jgi:hypothetical protein
MFSPDHFAGRFSCSDVAIRNMSGGVRMGVENDSIDCDFDVCGWLCAPPLGHEATPFDAEK